VIAAVTQRWRDRRGSYRPSGEVIDTRAHDVAAIDDDATAKAFVVRHHYAASYPAARRRFGLYHRDELVGVAVFSQPVNNRSLACLPGGPSESLELGRFVLLHRVKGNGESWMIARCFDLLRAEGFSGVIAFSDPVPRTTSAGATILPGHYGGIYQATNAVYRGRSKAETLRLLPDGHVLHNRALAKIRARERGWRPAAALLEKYGADPLGETQDPRAWLRRWTARLCRPLRHTGNHRYCFGLTKAARRHLPESLPYPKFALTQGSLAFSP
jgi:hypothetical protein